MRRLAAVVALAAITFKFTEVRWPLILLLASIVYLLTGGWRWVRLVSKTIHRDLIIIKLMPMLIYLMAKARIKKTATRDLLHQSVKKHPDKLALVMADTNKSLTFKQAENLCFKIANTFYEAGYRRGDVVALLMENRIEYMLIWIGLSMIGVITSLINYNLHGDSLKHCIDVCDCKAIIFSEELSGSIREIKDEIKVKMYCYDECETSLTGCQNLPDLINSASCVPPEKSLETKPTDMLIYLYTSGTTGFPKAVKVKGEKILFGVMLMKDSLYNDDILYQSLPLYHGNGLGMAFAVFLSGCTVVVKKRFSASQFIVDCCKYNVTVINYIGEICRYILAQPKSVFDDFNRVRVAIGNGLRASIWTEFKDRFKINTIFEFYGSTEGNTVLIPNFVGRVGAVGFRPLILPNRDLKLVKVDKETGEILRGSNGLALEAGVGEPGQAVGKITTRTKFDGYTDEKESKKKIAYDIFNKGDSAFLSGDILVRDEEGFYYFRDRTGDTFRWKGENVSTNEVEGLISKVIQLNDVCVYGVEVPGNEGKAGMACICDPQRVANIADLPKALNQILPRYAQPVFLRLTNSLTVTGTYKFEKKTLQREGFDPHVSARDDTLYYFDSKEKKFMLLDDVVYQDIIDLNIRF